MPQTRLLLVLMAIMLLISVPASSESADNLLVNPGFEEAVDGQPVGWTCDAYISREGISLYQLTQEARTGNYAVSIENCDMNDARYAQTVEVKPNAMYRLSGWIKAVDVLDAGKGANLSIEGVYVFSDSLYQTNGEWVYVETYGLTDKDQTEVTVFARVGGYSGESQGKAFFDDLSLVEVQDLPEGMYAEAWYTVQTVQVADPSGDQSDEAAGPFWPWLLAIAFGYAAAAVWLMRHFQLDRSTLALREAAELHGKHYVRMPAFAVVGLCCAAVVRLFIALTVDGYQVDINCFTAWGNTMASVGPAHFYQSNWCDYTPGYIYVMGVNGWLANLLQGVVDAAFVHKIVPMICDLAASVLLFMLAVQNRFSRRQAGLYAVLFAFNPAIMLNSAAWCQVDSVLCLGLMLVAYFAIKRRWAIVLPLYVLCILVKPQALMLGFLGLAALIMEWMKHPAKDGEKSSARKDMLIGAGISVLLALVVILPFCPNQDSPFWLFRLYGNTLASYPYATVNTANAFYLVGANWSPIEADASTGLMVLFGLLSIAWGTYQFIQMKRHERQHPFLEPALMLAYAVVYFLLAIVGTTWVTLGFVAMSMAFALVLPIFVRSGKLENLPLCGAVIFLLLYVFGIKMHERYLFPALFLLGMAYAIRRDRRILGILIGASCVLFINEGIVLDNSIRLGSSMGHLNADTDTLAKILSVMNVLLAVIGTWVCDRVCTGCAPVRLDDELIPIPGIKRDQYSQPPCTPGNFRQNAKLGLKRWDIIAVAAVTMLYSIVTLTTLGSTKAPQKPWKSSAVDEYVYLDLGQHYDEFSVLYFCQVSYSNFAVSVTDDPQMRNWSEAYPAEMREGLCFSWQYLDPSYAADGTTKFADASSFANVQKLSGRYVRIDPQQVGLIINEIIFKDKNGNIIPDVKVVGRENANAASTLYSDPECLIDEQGALTGEPSWWNSTYFDEIYHARTAFEHLNETHAYEWTHPPLGKIIMSWFIAIFGMTPFGWRFGGALCGILMLPVMYLLVKQLTKRSSIAFAAMLMMALDCMHFTQTRIATIDSYPVLFIMLSYFFMLRFMQRDIVLDPLKKLLPELCLSGFFMGCSVASKWIGVYAGIGLAVLYFWTCLRHIRMGVISSRLLDEDDSREDAQVLKQRAGESVKRVLVLCLWCLLFFVAVPVGIYLLSYVVHFADRSFDGIGDFLTTVYNTNFGKYNSMLSYHGTPGLGMDHYFYSPWYEWPLMVTPMYYASAAFKPDGMTYAIFCFGNPWVWVVGLGGIAYTIFIWAKGHHYQLANRDSTFNIFRKDWNVAPAFILIGLLAQFLPWVLVPRGTYIYHYFASVPFLILATSLLLDAILKKYPKNGKRIIIVYLVLCLIWFVILFPYASGVMTDEGWMDFIRDYPYINTLPDYWQNDFLVSLNAILEKIPIFPNVYHH